MKTFTDLQLSIEYTVTIENKCKSKKYMGLKVLSSLFTLSEDDAINLYIWQNKNFKYVVWSFTFKTY